MRRRALGRRALGRRTLGAVAVAVVAALTSCSQAPPPGPVQTSDPVAPPTAEGAPATPTRVGIPDLRVSEVAGGFSHVWDVGFLPDGRVLITERAGRLTLLSGTSPGATATAVAADFDDLYVEGEGGLLGLVVHPDFARSRSFTTCQTHTEGGRATDVRLVTWQLAPDGSSATRTADPLVGGLPINQSGRHSGCRPTVADDGALLVGTGDTARGDIPQSLTSMGGKVLRVDLQTGAGLPDNPFADADNPDQQRIYTYGHRNVQGVAVQPGTGAVFTAEHGPSTDDEVNRLVAGANFGWDPAQGGTVSGYDESVPMTDLDRYPAAVAAVWSSGSPVEAVAGAAFLSGPQWGDLDGVLAVAALRGEKLLFLTIGADGSVESVDIPEALDGAYSRLRAVRLGPDGSLYVTTSNGNGADRVLRIDPV